MTARPPHCLKRPAQFVQASSLDNVFESIEQQLKFNDLSGILLVA